MCERVCDHVLDVRVVIDVLCRVAVGECFIAESSDAASEFVTAELDRVRGEMEEVDAAVTAIDERMALLKKSLYGRFGKAIHLENDDDE